MEENNSECKMQINNITIKLFANNITIKPDDERRIYL